MFRAIGKFVWAIGTWVFIYFMLVLAKIKMPKTVLTILLLINLYIFPYALEYLNAYSSPQFSMPFSNLISQITLYVIMFFALGPLSIIINLKYIYIIIFGG